MTTKYIIRFDDFYSGMDAERFYPISDWLLEERIPAIIGLVPAWKPGVFEQFLPEELKDIKFVNESLDKARQLDPSLFIERIQDLQNNGCEIALHGYTHEQFISKNILNVNPFGEFAGLPYGEQKNRLNKGKTFFKAHRISCRTFMAPGHSFDENTLKALGECGIRVITDGKSLYPYKKSGIIFIPQITSQLEPFPFGIITICLHPQFMTYEDFKRLKDFTSANKAHIVSVDFALDFFRASGIHIKMLNSLSQFVYKIKKVSFK